jgi:hypothetical protein
MFKTLRRGAYAVPSNNSRQGTGIMIELTGATDDLECSPSPLCEVEVSPVDIAV